MKEKIKRIHSAVDKLFDRMKDRFIGARLVDKQLILTTDRPDLTIVGIATAAAADGGARMSPQSVLSLAHIATSYLDAAKEKAKALIVRDVLSHDDPTPLQAALVQTWETVTNDVMRIADTEVNRARSLGGVEGIAAMNAAAGIDDPTVFFVVVRDGHRCKECTRLHLRDDRLTPRTWKLSELGAGYHKVGEQRPKISGLHPHCRCTMATLLPGYGFDASGMVKFIAPGHDEYAKQRT